MEAFIAAYEVIDDDLKNQDSGTTAVNFYIRNSELFYANAGDARLILMKKGKVIQLSQDHRLDNPEEEKRILESGGQIDYPYVRKCSLGLMPTRTLGDEYFKEVGLMAAPAVGRYEFTSEQWLLGGTDGLFDIIENEEVGRLLLKSEEVNQAALTLKKAAIIGGGGDNLTFILLHRSPL